MVDTGAHADLQAIVGPGGSLRRGPIPDHQRAVDLDNLGAQVFPSSVSSSGLWMSHP